MILTTLFRSVNEKMYAFLWGFVPSTIQGYLLIEQANPFMDLLFKIINTAVLGIFGGIAGMLAKDLYKWVKKQITTTVKRISGKKG